VSGTQVFVNILPLVSSRSTSRRRSGSGGGGSSSSSSSSSSSILLMQATEHNSRLTGRFSLVALLIVLFVVLVHTCSYVSVQKYFMQAQRLPHFTFCLAQQVGVMVTLKEFFPCKKYLLQTSVGLPALQTEFFGFCGMYDRPHLPLFKSLLSEIRVASFNTSAFQNIERPPRMQI
jgi:hypothetical protein